MAYHKPITLKEAHPMKKLIALVLSLILALGCTVCLAEDAKPLAGKKLLIALSPNFMYFETVSETDPLGYEGLDIDIIKELADILGFEFEIVPMSFSSLVGSLQSGSADMVISGMTATEERKEVVDFSDVYCTTEVGCVVQVASEIASYDDLKGKVICCSQGTNYEIVIENDIEGATLKTYQGQAAVGTAVAQASDGVEAGLTGINGAKKLANTVLDADGNPLLKYFAVSGVRADAFSIAFPKGSELTALVNAALQQLTESGKLDAMIKQWLY